MKGLGRFIEDKPAVAVKEVMQVTSVSRRLKIPGYWELEGYQ